MLLNPFRLVAALVTKVYDTFTGSNGTALTSHSPDTDVVGGGWASLSGTWTIQSNQAQGIVSGNNAAIDAGVSNCVVTLDLSPGSSSSSSIYEGILARVTDDGNNWLLGIAAPSAANPILVIYERSGGSATLRASATMTGEGSLFGEQWPLQATLSGNDLLIETTINGHYYSTSYNSSNLASNTKHGMRCRVAGYFDNFKVVA